MELLPWLSHQVRGGGSTLGMDSHSMIINSCAYHPVGIVIEQEAIAVYMLVLLTTPILLPKDQHRKRREVDP